MGYDAVIILHHCSTVRKVCDAEALRIVMMKLADNSETDEALLQRVALKRDEAAFSELVSRMNQVAYCLAYHITGNAGQAEEIVQESMVAVWLSSAKNDVPVTNARAWVSTIVARQAFKIMRLKRKSERREVPIDVNRFPQERSDPAAAELIVALRSNLLALEEKDRQLIALYFGGELSQMEISRELAIPQRTISHRINRVLQYLRGALLGAGVAAIIPLDRALLQSALQGGQAAPAPALAELLLKVKASESLRWIPPVKLAISSKVAISSAIAASVFLAAAITLLSRRTVYEDQAQAVEPVPVEVAARPSKAYAKPVSMATNGAGTAALPKVNAPFFYRWQFPQDYVPEDFVVAAGDVRCETNSIRIGTRTRLVIAKPLPAGPVLLTADLSTLGGKTADFGARLVPTGSDEEVATHAWLLKTPITVGSQLDSKIYIVGNFAYVFLQGKLAVISEYKESGEARQIRIEAGNVACRTLQLETIKPEALPPELSRPIDELTKDMIMYPK
jgi:RNA polymerase sigma-70 factor, ECF subfamily